MTHLKAFAGLFLAVAAVVSLPGSAQAGSSYYRQAEDALGRSLDQFYAASLTVGKPTPEKLDELQKQFVDPVANKYNQLIADSWNTAIERRIRQAAEAPNRTLEDPLVAKALGVPVAPSTAAKPSGAGEQGMHRAGGSGSSMQTGKGPVLDGKDVPKLLEFGQPKKKPASGDSTNLH